MSISFHKTKSKIAKTLFHLCLLDMEIVDYYLKMSEKLIRNRFIENHFKIGSSPLLCRKTAYGAELNKNICIS